MSKVATTLCDTLMATCTSHLHQLEHTQLVPASQPTLEQSGLSCSLFTAGRARSSPSKAVRRHSLVLGVGVYRPSTSRCVHLTRYSWYRCTFLTLSKIYTRAGPHRAAPHSRSTPTRSGHSILQVTTDTPNNVKSNGQMSLSTLNAAESTASSSSNSISSTSHDSATTSPFKSSLAPVLHPSTPTRSSNPSSSACSSAHPSPNGTLTRSPSMDAMTPRSLKQYSADELGSAALGVPSPSPSSPSLTHEPADSPFFAGWQRDSRTHNDSGSPQGLANDLTSSPDQKRYSLSSSLG